MNRIDETVWQSNPGPQTLFLTCPVYEVFYGGARGGGKTDGLLGDYGSGVQEYGHAWRGILFRRSYSELEDIITRSQEIYYRTFPGSLYSTTRKTWFFPNGAILKLRYVDKDKDILRYQGHSYSWIGFDQLEAWGTPFCWDTMRGCARSPYGAPVRLRATGNPGGPGHHWVKARYIDPVPPLKVFADPNEKGFERVFIPSLVTDNPKWAEKDPYYKDRLEAIQDSALRKAWRWGDWDAFVGNVFSEWDRNVHVIRPFLIPEHWTRFVAGDWGFARPFWIGWFAVDEDNRIFLYREFYGQDEEMAKINPDTGIRKDSVWVGKRIKEFEQTSFIGARGVNEHDLIRDRVLSPDAFAKHGNPGPTVAEGFAESNIYFRKANNDRLNGLWQCHLRLAVPPPDARGNPVAPMFQVFDICRHFIRTIPPLDHDKNNPEDVDKHCEDHPYEGWRYGMMSRPILTMARQKEDKKWLKQKRGRRPNWRTV